MEFVGFVSDKQKGFVAMRKKYYPSVQHQYCIVHFLDNITKEMREIDNTLKIKLRSEVKNIGTFKTIQKKAQTPTRDLVQKEFTILSDTRKALLAVVKQKKKNKFELTRITKFDNCSKAIVWLDDLMEQSVYLESSPKFQVLLSHLVG